MATIAGGFAGGKARAGRTLAAFTIIAACGISPASQRRDAIDRAVLGQRPGYGRASISVVPNLAAANWLIWVPGLDQGWDPQGLAVARGSLFVSGYRSLGTWQNRGPCRVFRVDPESGRETGHFDVPIPCGHAGGLAYAGAGKLFIADTHTLFEVDLDRAFSGAAPKFRVFPLGPGLKGAFAVSGDGAIWIGDYEETRPAKAFKFDLAALRSLPDGAVLSAAMAAAVVPLPSWTQGGAVDGKGRLWISRSDIGWGFLDRLDPASGRLPAALPGRRRHRGHRLRSRREIVGRQRSGRAAHAVALPVLSADLPARPDAAQTRRGGGLSRPAQARSGTPLCSSTCCNSPVSYISRMMSQPPTNSPLT